MGPTLVDNVRMQRIIAKLALKADAMDELIRRCGLRRQDAAKALHLSGLSQRDHAGSPPVVGGKLSARE
jgi:hypothetical protein